MFFDSSVVSKKKHLLHYGTEGVKYMNLGGFDLPSLANERKGQSYGARPPVSFSSVIRVVSA